MFSKIIAAIVEDDRNSVRRLLKDARLITQRFQVSWLSDSGIFHWFYEGDSALHVAAAGYRVEIIQMLLAAGYDPNLSANRRKSSPLHYAADGFITGPAWDANRQVQTLERLLEHGSMIHLQDMNGATALHRAVRTRCAAAVDYLLRAGGDPNMENKSGSTAFHLAVQNTGRGGSGAKEAIEAQRRIIRTFLKFGCDPNRKNTRGTTVRESVRSAWIREMLDA